MSKIVFILGAGASAHCGTPLMNDFLQVAEDLWRGGEVEEAKEDFQKVFEARGKLQAVHSKAKINTYNLEDVFAAFEMGKLLGRLPGIEESDKIEELISSIKKVIGYTLEKTTKVPTDARVNPFQAYYEFTNIMVSLMKVSTSFSVITFNYDLGLDYALYKNKLLPDYGLGDVEMRGKSVTYLKLHGSINWGRCSNEECRKIVPYREFKKTEFKAGSDYGILPIISGLKRLKCSSCNKILEEDPFIVPPTWNKTAFHEQIDQVWRKAALELKDAENIFVLGYSFPDTDMFFRYLFALGVDMATSLRGFYVYNPDLGRRGRFEDLLGSGVIERFHFQDVPFEEAIKKVSTSSLGIGGISTIPQILNI